MKKKKVKTCEPNIAPSWMRKKQKDKLVKDQRAKEAEIRMLERIGW